MKKDLIIIVAYCPDQKRKDTLYQLLNDLQHFRDSFDILLTSHTIFGDFFNDMVDYFYYDKENIVLTDLEYQQNGWYSVNGSDIIWSSYINIGNYLPSIYKILIPALSIAKSLGYNKIHKLEYDTRISNIDELHENSKLLDQYDYVIYKNPSTDYLSGNFMSFKMGGIIDLWKVFDLDSIKNLIKSSYPKTSELIIDKEIKKTRKYLEKDLSELKSKGIDSGKIISNKTNWSFPFFDYDGHFLRFLNVNYSLDPYLSEVIVNNKTYFNFGQIKQNCLQINDIDSFSNIKNITIMKDKKVYTHIDLENDSIREEFIKRNFLEKR